ncbi:hypothetical protein PAXINDRAFT_166854 [Paxillus involutus ATCC 200175]|nr:hypothetical protein PAXINDRAFT_166854 [Paxillus involutus ATCC 200175]
MVRPAAHSFPHRGSPATTTHSRVRWQPYNASIQTLQSRSSPSSYLVTPASSVSSVSPSPRPLCAVDRPRHTLYPPRDCKLRETQKSKYALNLVDQTVKSLCDIWPPQDIPTVFLTSGRPMVASTSGSDQQHASPMPTFPSRNTQLPSPVSPTTTQPSPVTSPVAPHSRQALRSPEVCTVQTQPCDVASMKGFVHEVLRRSRTSGSVLQTALCYLEAIRAKIPELVIREKLGLGTTAVAELDDRITQGQVGVDTDLGGRTYSTQASSSSSSLLDTVRINPVTYESDGSFSTELELDADKVPIDKPKTSSPSLPPLPLLPSPLLCPRRTFLASLILASKFMQDRCYSNRAWAKLSGLPPREIGRCERALGEALEWRLWVGKLPAAQTASTRALTKCKSESDILLASKSPVPQLLVQNDAGMDVSPPSWNAVSSPVSMTSSLRRHATLPVGNTYREDPFLASLPVHVNLEGPSWSLGSMAPCSVADNVSPSVYSSSPSTPGLSYSPTPTESSLGDRTIQMSSFMDVSTPPPGQFATFAGAQNDKANAVSSSDLYVRASSQDVALPSLSHRFDVQFLVSHGVVSTNGFGVYNTWGTDYA